ncbi:MAG: phenylalanine--tRNA ligase subunit alpha [Candidatus Omnitrophota bacterium]|jgi:phenylalanyl-tRNA synthetase alpha chain|nr:MAG: phenylalanine--tRNA ligase subunit alpha [Candidatus Omnitrophota bacterium]
MDIEAVKNSLNEEVSGLLSQESLEAFRVKYLGRKGVLAQLTSSIPSLPAEKRKEFGREVNELKARVLAIIEEKQRAVSAGGLVQQEKLIEADVDLPGEMRYLGKLHPVTQVIDEICNIFEKMGFSVLEGPEVETEFNNFTGLNIPLDHPSRDAFDTFYIKNHDKLLLRSHTSPVQVRAMKKHKPPLAIVVPGKVYRPDAVDASHLFMFHQVEGFLVDKCVSFSDLKGALEVFVKSLFGKNIKMRLRPHFFPFTEPSAEVDISCIICQGKGCSVCGRKGWLEILGSGMIHPNVFKHVGYDLNKFSGFAFGMGVERIAMLKYGIDDIRLFFENDIRFLKQF